MGGRGGVQGFGRLSGMASGVMRDSAGHRGYVGVFGAILWISSVIAFGILFCEIWYMVVCATPQIVLNAVISRSSVQEVHLLPLIGSDQRELS